MSFNFKQIKFRQILSRAGEGGNRRLFIIGGFVASLVIVVLAVSSIHHRDMPQSNAGMTQTINPLPGGLNATPKQEQLRHEEIEDSARTAQKTGNSYTPDFAPGKSVTPPEPIHEVGEEEDPSMAKRLPTPSAQVAPTPVQAPVQTAPAYAVAPSSDGQGPNPAIAKYTGAINALRNRMVGHIPVTSVMFTQEDLTVKNDATDSSKNDKSSTSSLSQSASNSVVSKNHVLIPAGRGIYAHTVTATNSDLNGDIVLEADSGPIAGDRMIASVSRAGGHMNRLVLSVRTVYHKGNPLTVTGMVVAPKTMEAAVASSVDQLYVERFILPGAAAFVQGLGSALETTSNTVGSIGGLGNVNYVQRLNFPQQLGVAAGQAASQVNSALMQQMPTQARVNMAANVSVGVVFTTNVETKN